MYISDSKLSELVNDFLYLTLTKDEFINRFDEGINQRLKKTIDCFDNEKNYSEVLYDFFNNSYDYFAYSFVYSKTIPEQLKKESNHLVRKIIKKSIINNYIYDHVNSEKDLVEISAKEFREFVNMALNKIRKYNIPIFEGTSFIYEWDKEKDKNKGENKLVDEDEIIEYGFGDMCNDIWYKTFPNRSKITLGNKKIVYEFLFYIFAYVNYIMFVPAEDIKKGGGYTFDNKHYNSEYEFIRINIRPVNNSEDKSHIHEKIIYSVLCQLIYIKKYCKNNGIDIGFSFEINPGLIMSEVYGYSEDWNIRKRSEEILIIAEAINNETVKKSIEESIREDAFFIDIMNELRFLEREEKGSDIIIDAVIETLINEILGNDFVSSLYIFLRSKITFSKSISSNIKEIIHTYKDDSIKFLHDHFQERLHKNKKYKSLGKKLIKSKSYIDFWNSYPNDIVLMDILNNIIHSLSDLYEYKRLSKKNKYWKETDWDKTFCEGLNTKVILNQHIDAEMNLFFAQTGAIKLLCDAMWNIIFREYSNADENQTKYKWKIICKKMIEHKNNKISIDNSILNYLLQQELSCH